MPIVSSDSVEEREQYPLPSYESLPAANPLPPLPTPRTPEPGPAYLQPVPKNIHFIVLGGALSEPQKQSLTDWLKANRNDDGYKISLWYNSAALLAEDLKKHIERHARAKLKNGGNDTLEALRQEIIVQQNRAYEFIEQKQSMGLSFDTAVVEWLESRGEDTTALLALKQKYKESFTHFNPPALSQLELCDIHLSENPPYIRQQLSLGKLREATDYLAIHVLLQDGGIYIDLALQPKKDRQGRYKPIGNIDIPTNGTVINKEENATVWIALAQSALLHTALKSIDDNYEEIMRHRATLFTSNPDFNSPLFQLYGRDDGLIPQDIAVHITDFLFNALRWENIRRTQRNQSRAFRLQASRRAALFSPDWVDSYSEQQARQYHWIGEQPTPEDDFSVLKKEKVILLLGKEESAKEAARFIANKYPGSLLFRRQEGAWFTGLSDEEVLNKLPKLSKDSGIVIVGHVSVNARTGKQTIGGKSAGKIAELLKPFLSVGTENNPSLSRLKFVGCLQSENFAKEVLSRLGKHYVIQRISGHDSLIYIDPDGRIWQQVFDSATSSNRWVYAKKNGHLYNKWVLEYQAGHYQRVSIVSPLYEPILTVSEPIEGSSGLLGDQQSPDKAPPSEHSEKKEGAAQRKAPPDELIEPFSFQDSRLRPFLDKEHSGTWTPTLQKRLQIDWQARQMGNTLKQAVTALTKDTPDAQHFIPLFSTLREDKQGQWGMEFYNPKNSQQTLRYRSADGEVTAQLKTIKAYFTQAYEHIDRAHAHIKKVGLSNNPTDAPTVDGLNSAFAIQALIRWFAGKSRNEPGIASAAGVDGSLALAVQIHDILNSVQIAQGVLQDADHLALLVKGVLGTANRGIWSGLSGGLLAKLGIGLQIISTALSAYELSTAHSSEQKAVFGTRLAFDSTGLSLITASMLGAETAGPIAILVGGLSIGIGGLVDAYNAVAQHASEVGAHLARLKASYAATGYRYDSVQKALLPQGIAVVRRLDLRSGQLQLSSPLIYRSKHGQTGSGKNNYFFWAGDMPYMVHQREQAINIAQRLGWSLQQTLPEETDQTNIVLLPSMPQYVLSYAYNTLPFATTYHDPGFDVLRTLEGDDFDFDFYIFPSEYIIDRLTPEYLTTEVEVILDKRDRYLQMPDLPKPLQGWLNYHLKAEQGQYTVGLISGASLTLDNTAAQSSPLWILDTRRLGREEVRINGKQLTVGGIRIKLSPSTALSSVRIIKSNGDIARLATTAEALSTESIMEIDADQWPTPEKLNQHLSDLKQAHRFQDSYIVINRFPLPATDRSKVIPRAYYEVAKNRYLYAANQHKLLLATQLGDRVYFYNEEQPTNKNYRQKLYEVDANSHQTLSIYGFEKEKYFNVWQENGTVLLSKRDTHSARRAVYRIDAGELVLQQLYADEAIIQELNEHTQIADINALFNDELHAAFSVVNNTKPARLPTQGLINIDYLQQEKLVRRYWLRPSDGRVIKPRFTARPGETSWSLPADINLIGQAVLSEAGEVFYFYSQQQKQLYQQKANNEFAQRVDLKISQIIYDDQALYALSSNGQVHHLDAAGHYPIIALTKQWLLAQKNQAWWLALDQTAHLDTVVSILDLKAPEEKPLATWYSHHRLFIAQGLAPHSTEFLGLDSDQCSAWLYESIQGQLLRQPQAQLTGLKDAFSGINLTNGSVLAPIAQTVSLDNPHWQAAHGLVNATAMLKDKMAFSTLLAAYAPPAAPLHSFLSLPLS